MYLYIHVRRTDVAAFEVKQKIYRECVLQSSSLELHRGKHIQMNNPLLALCFCTLQHHCFAVYPGLVYYTVFLSPLPTSDRHNSSTGIAINSI